MKKIVNVTNAEYSYCYGNGFANPWELFDAETGKRQTYMSTGLVDGNEVTIMYRPIDEFNERYGVDPSFDDEDACDWGAFWVLNEDGELIGTEQDFEY